MPDIIKPFRATYYNLSVVKNLDAVACPPYDVITPEQLRRLRRRSPYNYTNIDLCDHGDYKKVASTFNTWIEKGVFCRDDEENLYLYGQQFKNGSRIFWRYGLMALLRMDKKDSIFPHERTLSRPKRDRMRMMRVLKANMSPIFIIAPKPVAALESLRRECRRRKPFLRFKDIEGNDSAVWRIGGKAVLQGLNRELEKTRMVIADGHHRFEVSFEYFQRNRGKFKDLNYVMAYIADVQDGLVILPIHRIAQLPLKAGDFLRKLEKFFYISGVSESSLKAKLRHAKVFSFGVRIGSKFYFAKIKDGSLPDKKFKGSLYRKLDTFLLHEFVFPACGIDKVCKYANDMRQVKEFTRRGRVAFIMRPASLEAVHMIANAGHRLPQKSTYFYPKVASGVLMRKFRAKGAGR